jgi:hypothetical protein
MALFNPKENLDMKVRLFMLPLMIVAALQLSAQAQALADPADSSGTVAITTSARRDLTYLRPTTRTKLHSYMFDAFGPYPAEGAGLAAGINQADNTPPDWKQGAAGYGKRFGSDFGIAAVTTTTRYALARVFREDTLYYRCQCRGLSSRSNHALVSVVSARRGEDGHRVFSFSALVAPYMGTTTAVYGWFPGRYNVKDAFRMGNYSLLGYVGENIALEFMYSGPQSWLHRMHLNNEHGAPDLGSNR